MKMSSSNLQKKTRAKYDVKKIVSIEGGKAQKKVVMRIMIMRIRVKVIENIKMIPAIVIVVVAVKVEVLAKVVKAQVIPVVVVKAVGVLVIVVIKSIKKKKNDSN